MSIFARAHYRSEITNFIDEMKQQKPDLEAQQRAGRALLWDKQLDAKLQADYMDGKVAQQPYVYQTNSD